MRNHKRINLQLLLPLLSVSVLFIPLFHRPFSTKFFIRIIYIGILYLILLYGYNLLKSDLPKVAYINPLIGFFFLYTTHLLLTDIVSPLENHLSLLLIGYSNFYQLALIIILSSKLKFVHKEFGRFYNKKDKESTLL